MFTLLIQGLCAGAAGTTAINLTTYLDMFISGRPASSTPTTLVRRLAQEIGSCEFAQSEESAGPQTQSKRSALGALLGYANGLGVAAVAAHVYPSTRSLGTLVNGVAIGAASMLASDLPIAKFGVSDPQTWSTSDWLRDAVPHFVYGYVTAYTLSKLAQYE